MAIAIKVNPGGRGRMALTIIVTGSFVGDVRERAITIVAKKLESGQTGQEQVAVARCC